MVTNGFADRFFYFEMLPWLRRKWAGGCVARRSRPAPFLREVKEQQISIIIKMVRNVPLTASPARTALPAAHFDRDAITIICATVHQGNPELTQRSWEETAPKKLFSNPIRRFSHSGKLLRVVGQPTYRLSNRKSAARRHNDAATVCPDNVCQLRQGVTYG
jgi:hypothetical protein